MGDQVVDRQETKVITPTERRIEESLRLVQKLHGKIFHGLTRYVLEKSSRLAQDVFYHGPGSWQALRTIYEDRPQGIMEHLLYPFTLGLEGSRDTRFRLEVYTDLILNVLERGEITGKGSPCEYLDLACGCSLGPIRAAKQRLKQTHDWNFRTKCSDIKEDAILYSKKMALEEGIQGLMEFDVYSISQVDRREPLESKDGVGTHGYMDYRTSEECIALLKRIRKVIKPGGTIIITNMKEKEGFDLTRFMMRFYGQWFIKYKSKEEMGTILNEAGFGDIEIRETPLGHHWIATGIKAER